MSTRIIVLLLLVFVLAGSALAQEGAPPMPEIDGDIIAQGLNGPQGVFVDGEGNVWIAESGMGGDEMLDYTNPQTGETAPVPFGQTSRIIRVSADGTQEEMAVVGSLVAGEDVLGAARVTELDGTVYATVGGWHSSSGDVVTVPKFSEVVALGDEVSTVSNLWDFELANNPDATTNLESHPYDLTAGSDGMLYVVDAAGNDLLRVDPETGAVELVAVFEGLPGVFPSPTRQGEMITDPVPTGITFGADGEMYVSLLSGAPFIPGTAKIVHVAEDGTVTDFAPSLTMLTDVTTGPDGLLYATQFGMFTQEGPVPNSGAVLRILDDGTAEVVVGGLPFVTSIAFSEGGDAYVSINGVAIPGAGMVVRYNNLTGMAGEPAQAPQ